MSRHRILELGAGPADEPCAQLGQCADFAAANTLELLAFKAAVIAINGEPPCRSASLSSPMPMNSEHTGRCGWS
ncbi:hypothetical protein [Novosphingobium sp. THN1]|uniref:hypothetical protein n=1 Tax=Novosphingobium sp. THN1 TaxID=1016987 RepID=UPI001F075D03|nr:hypothetical protein [Novosphingobium sp. THN1]